MVEKMRRKIQEPKHKIQIRSKAQIKKPEVDLSSVAT